MKNAEGWRWLTLKLCEHRDGYVYLEFLHTGNAVTPTLMIAAKLNVLDVDTTQPMTLEQARDIGGKLDAWLTENQKIRGRK